MRRPTRSLIVGVLVILGALGFLVYQGLASSLVYYITPSELLARGAAADGEHFRLGGQVVPGTVRINHSMKTARFVLRDPKGSIHVTSQGVPPPLFRAGMGVVVDGTWTGALFRASDLLVKLCSTYRVPTPGKVPPPDDCVTK
jgi:cytochrome c-type biogenesis protein CcmE